MHPDDPVPQTLHTIRDYIRYAASRFNGAGLWFGHGTAQALDEAAALVLHTLHLPYDLHHAYFDATLTLEERRKILDLIERRVVERKPLPYLTHEALFCGLVFYVDERVLVPRSPIAELILRRFEPWLAEPERVRRVLDLCTGSGCIGIACAHAFPEAAVDLSDLSEDALAVARLNIHKHGVDDRVRALQADLFDRLPPTTYDLIVSNPPYVSRGEWNALPPEYRAEPSLALLAGETGLDSVRRILRDAPRHLAPEGLLVVEVGGSAQALQAAFPQIPFTWVEFEHGGDGVFVMTAGELAAYSAEFL